MSSQEHLTNISSSQDCEIELRKLRQEQIALEERVEGLESHSHEVGTDEELKWRVSEAEERIEKLESTQDPRSSPRIEQLERGIKEIAEAISMMQISVKELQNEVVELQVQDEKQRRAGEEEKEILRRKERGRLGKKLGETFEDAEDAEKEEKGAVGKKEGGDRIVRTVFEEQKDGEYKKISSELRRD